MSSPDRSWDCSLIALLVRRRLTHSQSVGGAINTMMTTRSGPTRALSLVQVGELSAARQALEGASMAPGTIATLRELTDPDRRPPVPREGKSRVVAEAQPAERFQLASEEFLICVRKARRGAAAGPSGMTSDNLFPVLESEVVSGCQSIGSRAGSWSNLGGHPVGALDSIEQARWRGEGIVVGDILRRLVARTIAKQVSKQAEAATAPFQYALSTKAGCECVAHILQTLTDLDPEATVMSIDGVGAYDLISRNATFEGLL